MLINMVELTHEIFFDFNNSYTTVYNNLYTSGNLHDNFVVFSIFWQYKRGSQNVITYHCHNNGFIWNALK